MDSSPARTAASSGCPHLKEHEGNNKTAKLRVDPKSPERYANRDHEGCSLQWGRRRRGPGLAGEPPNWGATSARPFSGGVVT